MLTGLGQKARGQVRRLRTPPAQMLHHRRRDATYTTRSVPPAERGKPVALLYSHTKGNRKMTLQDSGYRRREQAKAGRQQAG